MTLTATLGGVQLVHAEIEEEEGPQLPVASYSKPGTKTGHKAEGKAVDTLLPLEQNSQSRPGRPTPAT